MGLLNDVIAVVGYAVMVVLELVVALAILLGCACLSHVIRKRN